MAHVIACIEVAEGRQQIMPGVKLELPWRRDRPGDCGHLRHDLLAGQGFLQANGPRGPRGVGSAAGGTAAQGYGRGAL